jgi:hypothetical protein
VNDRPESLSSERMLLEQKTRQLRDERIASAKHREARIVDASFTQPAQRPRDVRMDRGRECVFGVLG